MKASKELKIGLFVIIVLTASFFLINYLRGEDILDRENELKGNYEDIRGLVASAPVYIKGYKAGEVSEIIYSSEENRFEVVCSVLKDFNVPVDSRMVIYSVDIMGGKGIMINYVDSEEYASIGNMLQTAFEQDLLGGLGESIGPLLEKVTGTLDSLSVTFAGVNKVLSDNNVASIGRTLAHLENTMSEVKALAAGLQGRSGELDSFIVNLSAFSDRLGGIADKVDSTMTGVNGVMDSLTQADLDGLVNSFKSLVDNINDPDGSVGKILKNDSIYNSVDSLLIDVNSLVRKIQENPKKYLKISVF